MGDPLRHVSEILPAIAEQKPLAVAPKKAPTPPKALTRIEQRLLAAALDDDASVLYQHTVLCQTSIPYRDPGDETRSWELRNGNICLEISAGKALHPEGRWVPLGLPFGPKPRLVLYHLNTEALRTQAPVIEMEDSLTAFVRRTLDLDPKGRNIRAVKDQLSRLAAADFRFGMVHDGRAVTIKSSVIEAFDLWMPKNEKQRVLWPTTIEFAPRYFESLMQHAVPLSEAAVRALSHSAMALDVYTWLAQRLHRVNPAKPAFVPWVSLWTQFGQGYERIRDFRRVFRWTLGQVKVVYDRARYTVDEGGVHLHNSPPPVARRLLR